MEQYGLTYTVGELIDQLSKLPEHMAVWATDPNDQDVYPVVDLLMGEPEVPYAAEDTAILVLRQSPVDVTDINK